MLTTKEFWSQEFYSFLQQEFDTARRFLKSCGKPKDEVDRFWIDFHRSTTRICGPLLNMDKEVKELQRKRELLAERNALINRAAAIDRYLAIKDK